MALCWMTMWLTGGQRFGFCFSEKHSIFINVLEVISWFLSKLAIQKFFKTVIGKEKFSSIKRNAIVLLISKFNLGLFLTFPFKTQQAALMCWPCLSARLAVEAAVSGESRGSRLLLPAGPGPVSLDFSSLYWKSCSQGCSQL